MDNKGNTKVNVDKGLYEKCALSDSDSKMLKTPVVDERYRPYVVTVMDVLNNQRLFLEEEI